MFNQAKMKWLYNNFIMNIDNNTKTEGGDQVWIGKHLTKVLYLEKYFSNLVKSLEFDLSQNQRWFKINYAVNIDKDFMILVSWSTKTSQLERWGGRQLKYLEVNCL